MSVAQAHRLLRPGAAAEPPRRSSSDRGTARMARRRRRSIGSSSSTSPPSISARCGRRPHCGAALGSNRSSRPRRTAAGWRSSATRRTRSSSTPWPTCSRAGSTRRNFAAWGSRSRTASFVRKRTDDWGLQTRPRRCSPAPDDLVFDLTNRGISPSRGRLDRVAAGRRRMADPARPPAPRGTAGSAAPSGRGISGSIRAGRWSAAGSPFAPIAEDHLDQTSR